MKFVYIAAYLVSQAVLLAFVACIIMSLMMVVSIAEGNIILILPLAIFCGMYYAIYKISAKYATEEGVQHGE